MSSSGAKMIKAAREALTIARGDEPAARIHVDGHSYISMVLFRGQGKGLAKATAKLSEAEKRERDTARDRDHWKRRAQKAEAALASTGDVNTAHNKKIMEA